MWKPYGEANAYDVACEAGKTRRMLEWSKNCLKHYDDTRNIVSAQLLFSIAYDLVCQADQLLWADPKIVEQEKKEIARLIRMSKTLPNDSPELTDLTPGPGPW
jgi:hypothetical protein